MELDRKISTVKCELQFFYIFHNLSIIGSIERRSSGDQYVQYDTSRPDITSLVIVKLKNFRSNIVGCSNKFVFFISPKFLFHILLPLIRKTKVDYFEFECLLWVHEEVLWFKISVTYFLRVHIFYAFYYLREKLSCIRFTEISMLLQSTE